MPCGHFKYVLQDFEITGTCVSVYSFGSSNKQNIVLCPGGGIGSEVIFEMPCGHFKYVLQDFEITGTCVSVYSFGSSNKQNIVLCPGGGIGRHTGLKILGSHDRASSSLALGIYSLFFLICSSIHMAIEVVSALFIMISFIIKSSAFFAETAIE